MREEEIQGESPRQRPQALCLREPAGTTERSSVPNSLALYLSIHTHSVYKVMTTTFTTTY